MRIKKSAALLVLGSSVCAGSIVHVRAQNSRPTASSTTSWPAHEWTKGTLASVGIDEKILAGLDADLSTGKYPLVDSFAVFRCGIEVFDHAYHHDYGTIYAKEAKTRGPLTARLTGPYFYFDPAWHPHHHNTEMHTMQSVTKTT